MRDHCLIILCGLGLMALLGCDSQLDNANNEVYQHQQDALNDPMNYSVDMGNTDSGGSTSVEDPKAMTRDINDVFNP